jgi:hypothetical protein
LILKVVFEYFPEQRDQEREKKDWNLLIRLGLMLACVADIAEDFEESPLKVGHAWEKKVFCEIGVVLAGFRDRNLSILVQKSSKTNFFLFGHDFAR